MEKNSGDVKIMKKKSFSVLLIAVVFTLILLAALIYFFSDIGRKETPVYFYQVNETFPHDRAAFTQGFVYHNGFIYESTGQYGHSELRKVDLETGKVLQSHKLGEDYFGEGITIFDDKIYQLTWRNRDVFVYDLETFELLDTLSIPREGWGLTNDGEFLIQSDGSDQLFFLDPATLEVISRVSVSDHEGAVDNINELQYIDGLVYANIWKTYRIAAIDPNSGKVSFWVFCTGIIDRSLYPHIDVMNGIAYDEGNDRLLVTGKYWPYVYDISINKVEN